MRRACVALALPFLVAAGPSDRILQLAPPLLKGEPWRRGAVHIVGDAPRQLGGRPIVVWTERDRIDVRSRDHAHIGDLVHFGVADAERPTQGQPQGTARPLAARNRRRRRAGLEDRGHVAALRLAPGQGPASSVG